MGLLNKISKKKDKEVKEVVDQAKEEKKTVLEKKEGKEKPVKKEKKISQDVIEDVVLHPLVTEKTATLASLRRKACTRSPKS